jgi:hypothetical protein
MAHAARQATALALAERMQLRLADVLRALQVNTERSPGRFSPSPPPPPSPPLLQP